MRGFIARQLVETSQMVKLVQALLAAKYPDTRIVPIKASVSHDLREAAGFVKCREANDYHHAHDALLACRIGLFVQLRHGDFYDNPVRAAHVIKTYVRSQSEEFRKTHRMPGSSGFIVNSFMTSGFDKETGEVFRDAWDAEAEVEGIRRMLNYRDCFITRMPCIGGSINGNPGQYWEVNPCSPRSSKKLSLPLKRGLDVKKYGGYSGEQFAYFFIYSGLKKNEKNRTFRFAPVPLYIYQGILKGATSLQSYAEAMAAGEKIDAVRIERGALFRDQLIEIGDNRLRITGAEEVRNAREIVIDTDAQLLVKNIEAGNASFVQKYGTDGLDETISAVIAKGSVIAPGLMKKLKLEEKRTKLSAASLEDKASLLFELIQIINGANRQIDLTSVGGAKTAGQYKVRFTKELNDPNVDFYIIDQSVTGMFERRTKIGL